MSAFLHFASFFCRPSSFLWSFASFWLRILHLCLFLIKKGLSEEEVRAAAACAREEVAIRNRFSEMNAPRENSSVNKYASPSLFLSHFSWYLDVIIEQFGNKCFYLLAIFEHTSQSYTICLIFIIIHLDRPCRCILL